MENFILHILKINLLAAFCIVLVSLLSRFVKNRYSSLWRYLMWLIIAVFLLIPVYPAKEKTPVVTLEFSRQEYHFDTYYRNPTSSENSAVSSSKAAEKSSHPIPVNQNSVSKHNRFKSVLTPSTVLSCFFFCWIIGAALCIICKVSAYRFSVSSLKRWAAFESDPQIRSLYDAVCFDLHIKNPPVLMTHFQLQSPVLAGLKDTCLYLPDFSYSEKELELIFTHELCHYQRRDLWYKTLLFTVNALYWFNPFLYFMTQEAEKDVEYLCDSRVVSGRSVSERSVYRRLLLKTAAADSRLQYLSAGLNDNTTDFKQRIRYMMKAKALKKGLIPVIFLTLALLSGNLLVSCIADSTPPPLDLPPIEDVVSIQVHSFKEKASEYHGHLDSLLKYLNAAEPVDKKTGKSLHRPEEEYTPVTLRYKDDTKQTFYFFKAGTNWYAETENGSLYKNNDFSNVITLPDVTYRDKSAPEGITIIVDLPALKRNLSLQKQLPGLDTTVAFIQQVQTFVADGILPEKEVLSRVRTQMLEEEKQYQYAVLSGYELTEEELNQYMESIIDSYLHAENFDEINGYYQEFGTTFQESLRQQSAASIRRQMCIQKLWTAKFYEFRDGNDTINGKECWDTREYYNTFLEEIVYPQMENYDFSDFIKELDEAEALYYKNYRQK